MAPRFFFRLTFHLPSSALVEYITVVPAELLEKYRSDEMKWLKIPVRLHKELKIRAAEEETTILELTVRAIEQLLSVQ